MKDTKGKLKAGDAVGTSVDGKSILAPVIPSTTAYSVFQSSVKRAKNLLEIHKMAHGAQSRPQAFLADTHRAAIVLAISALDAFVRTLVIDRIVSTVANPSITISDKLRQQIKDYLTCDIILDAAREGDLSSKIEQAFTKRFEERSFQGVDKITEAMKLIGFDDIFSTIAKSASVNEATLKSTLGKFTKRRHIIAHRGDYDLSQTPPVEKKILKKDAVECIKTVERVAHEINKL